MARAIVALVRHGAYHQQAQTPSAHQPYPLTEEGESQARQGAVDILAALRHFDCVLDPVIHASPLLRAWQTAVLLQGELSLASGATLHVETAEALCERCVGSLANLTVAEIEAVIARDPRLEPLPAGWKSSSDFRLPFPGAESLREAGERVAAHLRLHAAGGGLAAGRMQIHVGHGGSFRHAAECLGALEPGQAPSISMYHARPIYLELDAGGAWRHAGGAWKQRRSDTD